MRSSVRLPLYSLAASMLEGLPSHRFFTPLPEFWKVLDLVAPPGVQLVDTGCGMGYLIGEAEPHGRRLVGIDIGTRVGQDPRVRREDALSYPWAPDMWPLICRPSHDGWAYDTMRLARQRGAAVLYVGLPRNYERDLGSVRSKRYGVVGEEGERLYVVEPYRM